MREYWVDFAVSSVRAPGRGHATNSVGSFHTEHLREKIQGCLRSVRAWSIQSNARWDPMADVRTRESKTILLGALPGYCDRAFWKSLTARQLGASLPRHEACHLSSATDLSNLRPPGEGSEICQAIQQLGTRESPRPAVAEGRIRHGVMYFFLASQRKAVSRLFFGRFDPFVFTGSLRSSRRGMRTRAWPRTC